MGDFAYSMHKLEDGRVVGDHSIDIILDDGTRLNTWENFFLAPMARPFVSSPAVKTEYINVPGADGALDYTEVLTGKPRYANRTGQWQFIMENDHFQWPVIMSQLLNTLHGKHCKIILTDDPEYYYKGRIQLNVGFGNKDYSSVVFSYNLDPFKYPTGSVDTRNWRWDELFGNTIYYGTFSVNGVKTHTLVNETGMDKVATINVTSPMKIYKCEEERDIFRYLQVNFENIQPIWLGTGDNEVTLTDGNNIFMFVGAGIVKVKYDRGEML